ncbi:MAG: hypothetical protein PHF74_00885 [Dehalococcoidales bacterium]|nr:hypothetical protein [Dehalococcoidales bacterium]
MAIKKYLMLFLIFTLCVLSASACSVSDETISKTTGNLQFYIENNSGIPLWGAKIVSEEQPEGQLKVTGITGDSGIVTFKNIAAGEYKFYISRFDYFPVEVLLTVLEGQQKEINIKMTVEQSATNTITTSPARTSFANLAANPESYNGKYIIIEGYWFSGFEIVTLAERLEASDFAEGNVQPAGIKIWISSGLSQEVSDKLYLQENNATGYPAYYGKVELTGVLEYGGEYGHLNSYSYLLTIYESLWIDWEP